MDFEGQRPSETEIIKAHSNKNNKKKIGGIITGAAVAAGLWLSSGSPDKPSFDSVDPVKAVKSRPDGKPPKDKTKIVNKSIDESLRVPSLEIPPEETAQPETIPQELQNKLDELQNSCDDFYRGDALTLVDPYRSPGIMVQIEDKFKWILNNKDWKEKYPQVANKSYLFDLCGGADHFVSRAEYLAKFIVSQGWPETKKRKALERLSYPGIFSLPGVDEIRWQIPTAAGYLSSEEDILRSAQDRKIYFDEIIQLLSNPQSKLTHFDKSDLAKELEPALTGRIPLPSGWTSLFSPEEEAYAKSLFREHAVLPNLRQHYNMFEALIDSSPKDPQQYTSWKENVLRIISSLEISMIEGGVKDLGEIGFPGGTLKYFTDLTQQLEAE